MNNAFIELCSYFLRTSTFLAFDLCFDARARTSNVNGLGGRSTIG